jgi:putative restriction endonuclease
MKITDTWFNFGKGNGVNSIDELFSRCSSYVDKNSTNTYLDNNHEIGCIVLENPVFLEEDNFFRPEDYGFNFAPQIVKLKYFNSDFPMLSKDKPYKDNFVLISEDLTEDSNQKSKKRYGQSEFRYKILKAYDFKCCVTNETCVEVLQAAHIQPYVNDNSNHIQNGLCLRSDIHKLFDEGLIAIDDDYKIIVSSLLTNSEYHKLNGLKLNLPKVHSMYPSLYALQKHRTSLFRDKKSN